MPVRPASASAVLRGVASIVAITASLVAIRAQAQPAVAEAATVFTIADGALALEAPAGWQRVQPKSGIVETEFAIPSEGTAVDGTSLAPGRMTVMGAGGSVEANIERWCGQFAQPDGSSTRDKAATKKLKVAGRDVTIVDIAGTYKDSPGGPFAGGKTIERPGYRMLAAIVEGPDGSSFLKFYGPAATVAKHADGFRTMVEGMVPAAK
ncbi:MAG: hypothetical protein ACKO40_09255 [Planctomycetaceae bacterium]